jgi:hypothetical protein
VSLVSTKGFFDIRDSGFSGCIDFNYLFFGIRTDIGENRYPPALLYGVFVNDYGHALQGSLRRLYIILSRGVSKGITPTGGSSEIFLCGLS